MNPLRTGLGVLLTLGVLAACSDPTAPDTPEESWVRTDSAVYHLRWLGASSAGITLTANYTNHSALPVWIHRECGFTDRPAWVLERSSGEGARYFEANCVSEFPPEPPIRVDPGETRTFELAADRLVRWPNHTIDPESHLGEHRVVFMVQRSPEAGRTPRDLLPIRLRASAPIRIELAEGFCRRTVC